MCIAGFGFVGCSTWRVLRFAIPHFMSCTMTMLSSSSLPLPRSRLACMLSHLPSLLFLLLLSISQCCSFFVPVSSQPKSTTRATRTRTPFFLLAASSSSNNAGSTNTNTNSNNRLAYIIDQIGEDPNEQVFADIADMCTDVFYKEGQMNAKPEHTLAPWKQSQITKLKKSSTADLKGRRQRYPETNEMFLAYQVVEAAEEGSTASSPLIIDDLDRRLVYNHNLPSSDNDSNNDNNNNGKGGSTSNANYSYVRGDLLGFVEITQRSYSLGSDDETDVRPFLTNLAVSEKARQSGIGSQLMEACERHIVDVWKMKDVALEVDYDNVNALSFYSKRGYQTMFSSPACQRYDVTGLTLKKVKCTKTIMLKTLSVC